jgi:hypothetical protein
MKRQTRLARRDELGEQAESGQAASQAPLEFNSAEEALRHDRSEVTVPSRVAERLESSIASSVAQSAPRRWWQKLFRR